MIAIWFGSGLLATTRGTCGYVYMVELMPKKAHAAVTATYNVMDSFIYVVAILYFWTISIDWFWYCLIGFVWQLVSLVLLLWVPESPRYLIKAGKFEKAKKAFKQIAKINNVRFDPTEVEPLENCEEDEPMAESIMTIAQTESRSGSWISPSFAEA